jgi:CHAT domain-containing protein
VLSGVVLAGASRTGEQAAADRGILTGEDLLGLPLEGLELVVLSAGDPGPGEAGGEGTFGLQRAWHLAGARHVVASLWKADDEELALMTLFYRNLWHKKLPPGAALRDAQLLLYRHPEAAAVAVKRGADPTDADLSAGRPADDGRRSPTARWAAFTFAGGEVSAPAKPK